MLHIHFIGQYMSHFRSCNPDPTARRPIRARPNNAAVQPTGKFPALTAEYESVNVEGLFVAGAASHGRDHRRGAGGFIHGFR
eukprot:SAG11_NODE_652_length_7925_cov_3.950166_8_plen_82_part_00